MTDTKQLEEQRYQELQKIYLSWHDGKRPFSGFIREIYTVITAVETAARIDEHELWRTQWVNMTSEKELKDWTNKRLTDLQNQTGGSDERS